MPNIELKFKKALLPSLFLLASLSFLFMFLSDSGNSSAQASSSPDAIAIRVMKNPNHYSPLRWYREQGFSGSPQTLLVDGYEAVRDGRTVYVNAANVTGDGRLYTNIYLISYNQNAEDKTIDIFGRILQHWKFNTNITGVGVCSRNPDRKCDLDSHCEGAGFCRLPGKCSHDNSRCFVNNDCGVGNICDRNNILKSEITRDTRRLSQLAEITIALENYRSRNGKYPALSGGTYLANRTVSTWPSWQDNFAKELGIPLPIDPINRMGDCGGNNFNPITCWDENQKSFAGSINAQNQIELPDDSFAFVYSADYGGNGFSLCSVMESGLLSGFAQGVCPGSRTLALDTGAVGTADNNPPTLQLTCNPAISGAQNYSIFIRAHDPDGDELDFSIVDQSPSSWTASGWSNDPTISRISNLKNSAKIDFSQVGNAGSYTIKIKADDRRGGAIEEECTINVSDRGEYCGDGIVQTGEDCDGSARAGYWDDYYCWPDVDQVPFCNSACQAECRGGSRVYDIKDCVLVGLLSNTDFESVNPTTGLPNNWSIKAGQPSTNIAVVQDPANSSNKVMKIEQLGPEPYPGTCNQTFCNNYKIGNKNTMGDIYNCHWRNDKCYFGHILTGRDQANCDFDLSEVWVDGIGCLKVKNRFNYQKGDGDTLEWPDTNRVMFGSISYDVSAEDWEIGQFYILKYNYKGNYDFGTNFSSKLCYHLGYCTQAWETSIRTDIVCGGPGRPPGEGVCPEQQTHCCKNLPYQKKPYSSIVLRSLQAGDFTAWQTFYSPFIYRSDMALIKNASGNRKHNIGISVGYNPVPNGGNTLYIDNFEVHKCENLR